MDAASLINRANQLNPNNWRYLASRGLSGAAVVVPTIVPGITTSTTSALLYSALNIAGTSIVSYAAWEGTKKLYEMYKDQNNANDGNLPMLPPPPMPPIDAYPTGYMQSLRGYIRNPFW